MCVEHSVHHASTINCSYTAIILAKRARPTPYILARSTIEMVLPVSGRSYFANEVLLTLHNVMQVAEALVHVFKTIHSSASTVTVHL